MGIVKIPFSSPATQTWSMRNLIQLDMDLKKKRDAKRIDYWAVGSRKLSSTVIRKGISLPILTRRTGHLTGKFWTCGGLVGHSTGKFWNCRAWFDQATEYWKQARFDQAAEYWKHARKLTPRNYIVAQNWMKIKMTWNRNYIAAQNWLKITMSWNRSAKWSQGTGQIIRDTWVLANPNHF